jgi:hypothetical protein
MDRDGSDKRILFPFQGQPGLVPPLDVEWSPNGRQVVFLYQGNLSMLDLVSGQFTPLTGDGQSTQFDWER